MTASSVHDARQENHYYNYHNTEQEQQQNLIEVSKNWNLHRTGKSTTNGRHFDSMNNSNMTTTSTMSSSSSVMQSSTTTLVQTTTLITNYHSADNTNNPLSNLYKSLSTLRLYSYILSVLSLLLSSSSVCVSSTKFKCSLRNTNKQPSSSISNNKTTGLVTGKVTLFVCAILSAIWLIESIDLATQMPKLDNFVGFTSPQFAAVEKIFRRNFEEGWEREGAALAVYYKGELVVDLQAGYADASAHRAWTPQTRTVVFSATKAVGALCVALLVDRGELHYSDFVSKYWPEFAQNGKENITVDWIMSHRAGLAALDEPISRADAFNPKRIADIIARQKPNWTPGTKSGYHAITYGWLVDQLIRRADPKRRGIGQFFREEIAQPHDIDFHIGLPAEEEHTMSRISLPSNVHLLKEIVYDPRILIMLAILYIRPPNSIAWRVRANPHWLKLQNDMNTFNDPELHQMEQAAALGITKAKDLGKLFALFQQGKIVSRELLEQFRRPQISEGLDAVILAPMAKGHGFLYEKHPYKRGRWLVGHPGYGGSSVMMDMENDLVIAYVSNGLKTGMGELTRTYRLLRNAVLSAL